MIVAYNLPYAFGLSEHAVTIDTRLDEADGMASGILSDADILGDSIRSWHTNSNCPSAS